VQAAARSIVRDFGAQVTLYSKTPVSVEGARNLTPAGCAELPSYCERLLTLRAHKGLTAVQAKEELQNPLYLAALMLEAGELDTVVSGSLSTTADVIRTGLHCLPRSTQTISSCFLMQLKGGESLIFSDCGVIPYPTAEQLCDIAVASTITRAALVGDTPKVAFLSFSTRGSAEHESVTKVREAFNLFKQKMPEVVADGELQFDAAFVPSVAQRKCPDSPVAGGANILVFPNLDAGNIAYKAVERLAGAKAIGPLIQGFKKPWLDLSRGCSALDIVSVAAAGLLIAGRAPN
jgi:phosphate acetyltransferase